MKKKYLCSMVRRFALLLLFSALNFSFAQSGPFAVTFPAVTGGNPGNLTVCSGQSKLTVQIDVTTAATGTAQVTVQLAPGVQYVPNSVAVTSTNASLSLAYSGGTPIAPQFN